MGRSLKSTLPLYNKRERDGVEDSWAELQSSPHAATDQQKEKKEKEIWVEFLNQAHTELIVGKEKRGRKGHGLQN